MNSWLWLNFLFLILFSGSILGQSLSQTLLKVKPGIVGIGTYQAVRNPQLLFRGTGFAVADGLHIVTNAHVLPVAVDYSHHEFIAVFLPNKKTENVRKAQLVAKDESHDLAVLKISGPRLVALKLGDSKRVVEGELYAFTGFPLGAVLGLHPVTHQGIVSAITPIAIPAYSSRQLSGKMLQRLSKPYNIFQLDATAYPGNSGSPLFEINTGQVVGIINKVFVKETKENSIERPSGISYAIPVRFLKILMEKEKI